MMGRTLQANLCRSSKYTAPITTSLIRHHHPANQDSETRNIVYHHGFRYSRVTPPPILRFYVFVNHTRNAGGLRPQPKRLHAMQVAPLSKPPNRPPDEPQVFSIWGVDIRMKSKTYSLTMRSALSRCRSLVTEKKNLCRQALSRKRMPLVGISCCRGRKWTATQLVCLCFVCFSALSHPA